MNSLEIQYKINGTPEGLKNLSDLIREVGKDAGATSGQMTLLESVIMADVKAGKSLADIFKELAGSAKTLGPEAAKIVQQLQAMQNQADKTAVSYRELSVLMRNISSISGQAGVGIPGIAAFQGLSGTAGSLGALAGGAAIIASIVAGVVKLADATGQYAEQQENLASRTGLTIKEAQQFSNMATLSGVNVNALTVSMRTLSKGMSDSSTEGKLAKMALHDLGLSAATAFEPTGKALDDILGALGKLPDGFRRDRLAVDLFGRGALELLPLVDNLGRVHDAMGNIGIMTDEQIKKAREYEIAIHALGLAYSNLVHQVGFKAEGAVDYLFNGIKGMADTPFGNFLGMKRPVVGPEPQSPEEAAADLKATQLAGAKARLAAYAESVQYGLGTPRQKLESQLATAKVTEQTAQEEMIENPYDATKKKAFDDAAQAVNKITSAIEGLKKAAEPFSAWLSTSILRPGETNPTSSEYNQAQRAREEGERKYPKDHAAIEDAYYAHLAELNKKVQEEISTFNAKIQNEGEKMVQEFYTKQVKTDNDKFKEVSRDNASPFAMAYKEGKEALNAFIKSVNEAAKVRETQNQIEAAVQSGSRAHLKATGTLSAGQLATMDLSDSLNLIEQNRQAQYTQYTSQAAAYRQQARGLENTPEGQKYLDEATEAEARAKEAETKATLANIDAINKFQAAADAAANALSEKFGNFVESLLGSAEKGKSGDFVRKYLNEELNKIGGNVATSLFKELDLSQMIPGLPSGLGKGTLFAGVPKNPLASNQLTPGGKSQEYSDMEYYQHQQDASAKANPSLDANTTALQNAQQALMQLVIAITGSTSGSSATSVNPNGLIGAISDPSQTSTSNDNGSSASPTSPASVLAAAGIAGGGAAVSTLSLGSAPSSDTAATGQSLSTAAMLAKSVGAPSSVVAQLSQAAKLVQGIGKLTSSASAVSLPGSSADLSGITSSDLAQLAGSSNLDLNFGNNDMASALGGGSSSTDDTSSGPGGLLGAIQAGGSAAVAGIGSVFTAAGSAFKSLGSGSGAQTMAGLGMVAGGATTIMSGLKEGGAQGDISAVGGGLMSAGGIASMIPGGQVIGGALALAGLGTQLVSSLLGDPRVNRQNKILSELQGAQYNAPNPISVTETSGGLMDTTNYRGQNQVINARPTLDYYTQVNGFSQLPGQRNDLLTTPERYVTPGALLPAQTAPQIQPSAATTIVVQTLDSKSFNDNADKIATAMRTAMQTGHPVNQTLQNVIRPH